MCLDLLSNALDTDELEGLMMDWIDSMAKINNLDTLSLTNEVVLVLDALRLFDLHMLRSLNSTLSASKLETLALDGTISTTRITNLDKLDLKVK